MNNVKLMNCGFWTMLGKTNNDNTEMDVRVMALCPGSYRDMNGTDVEVDAKTIHSICDTYNMSVEKLYEADKILTPDIEKIGIADFDNRNAPNQLDHDDGTVLKTVGHVIGFMDVEDIDGKPYLFCTVRVKGRENVEPVRDKRRRNVSIQYHPKTFEFAEISWVVKGAAVEARALLSKASASNTVKQNINLSETFLNKLDTIQQTEKILLKQQQVLEKKLAIKKHLVALCVSGKINRATADFIGHELESKKIDNPEVIKLMESILPSNKFKPKYLNLLNKEEMESMSKEQAVALSAHEFIALAAKKPVKASEEPKPSADDTPTEKYGKSHSLKHKELMSKMAEAYEKGDVEMGKKYLEKAHKLADDCSDGMANLSDYDIDEKSEKSEEVKKLQAELDETKLKLSALKDEQTVIFNKFKDEQMVVLSQFTDKIASELNSSAAMQLLEKINANGEVK